MEKLKQIGGKPKKNNHRDCLNCVFIDGEKAEALGYRGCADMCCTDLVYADPRVFANDCVNYKEDDE